MNENKIRLAGVLQESLVNGEGIRRVLFSQGCPHNCTLIVLVLIPIPMKAAN